MHIITPSYLLNRKTATLLFLLLANTIFTSQSHAKTSISAEAKALIEKVITTYGGNKLTSASSITLWLAH